MEDLGHKQLYGKGKEIRIVQMTDLHHWPKGVKTFEQRGRIIDFDKEGYSADRNVELIRHVLERMEPDLVILTGDILDGRPCCNMSPNSFKDVMLDVLGPIIEKEIPWTFIPGNHDDDHSPWTRDQLIEIYTLPHCISVDAKSFNHTFTVGRTKTASAKTSVRLWLFDSGGNHPDPKLRYETFSPEAVEAYKNLSQDPKLSPSATGLAYFHIPLPEYEGIYPVAGRNALFDAALQGGKVPFPFNWQPFPWLIRTLGKDMVAGCSRLQSGIFAEMQKQGNILATFCGHDHHSDFVAIRDNIYLCYGRCGGYTPPHDWEGVTGKFPFDQGARVVSIRNGTHVDTWVTTFFKDQEDFYTLARLDENDS